MEKRLCAGRKLLIWGSIFLLVWAAYEFWVRLDVMWGWIKSTVKFAGDMGIPLYRAIPYYVNAENFGPPLFLLCCLIFSLLVIALRNRPLAGFLLIPLDALVALYAVGALNLIAPNLLQMLKLLPLILIALGCILNLCQFFMRRKSRGKRRKSRPEPEEAAWEDENDRARRLRAEVKNRRANRAG